MSKEESADELSTAHDVGNPRSGSVVTVTVRNVPDDSQDVEGQIVLGNQNIERQKEDILYHLGLSNFSANLPAMFGDTSFVCMGGSAVRAETFARKIARRFKITIPTGLDIAPIGKTERFSLFKVGPIISVNHGMGMPSMSILLHEITKLLFHAKAKNVIFMRIGTSGGLGVAPGTVVVSTEGLNGKLETCFEQIVLGKEVKHQTKLDTELAELAVEVASGDGNLPAVPCVLGKTIGTNDFYEGQGRFDGAVVSYSEEDKMEWLNNAYAAGARNIEMESTCFAAWCHRTHIRGMIMCATLLNRLEGDQVTATAEQLSQFSANAQEVALRVMQRLLKQ